MIQSLLNLLHLLEGVSDHLTTCFLTFLPMAPHKSDLALGITLLIGQGPKALTDLCTKAKTKQIYLPLSQGKKQNTD